MIINNPVITLSSAAKVGTPFLHSHNIGGEIIIAMKAASRKGTTIVFAALIPATTITKHAKVSSIREVLLFFAEEFMVILGDYFPNIYKLRV